MTEKLLMVGLGGGAGACLRYLTGVLAIRLFGHGFPWGTVIVNVVGSFLMGLLAVWLMERGGFARFAPLLLTGVLGGYTTFSAFSLDAVYLIERGRTLAAGGYVGGSVLLSVAGLMLGLWLGRQAWLP
ncbi:MAG TPA: fluoride efflux transporter CrcB [Thermohalobaculum sp.]|nr:fluoride efflux transporter CrcB [Thermohalobaculum sp.]